MSGKGPGWLAAALAGFARQTDPRAALWSAEFAQRVQVRRVELRPIIHVELDGSLAKALQALTEPEHAGFALAPDPREVDLDRDDFGFDARLVQDDP